MSILIELEIQQLLNQHSLHENTDLEQVIGQLLFKFKSEPDLLNKENITAFANFLLTTEKYQNLILFVLDHIQEENVYIPWPYFLEALGRSKITLETQLIEALQTGIADTQMKSEASRSLELSGQIPLLTEWHEERKYNTQKRYKNNKSQLIAQLLILRTQQLLEEEKKLLQQLQKLYPDDYEVAQQITEQKQRSALDIMKRYSPKRKNEFKDEKIEDSDPELINTLQNILSSLFEHARQDNSMAFEFAVAAYMFEAYDVAFNILNLSPQTPSSIWFRLELLLKCRRFVELLAELTQVEIFFANEPETFFATAYLRAQALWGLGQKHSAIQVLEGLLISQPQYRAAGALLSIWSRQ